MTIKINCQLIRFVTINAHDICQLKVCANGIPLMHFDSCFVPAWDSLNEQIQFIPYGDKKEDKCIHNSLTFTFKSD